MRPPETTTSDGAPASTEAALRRALRIPDDAARVLVFGESSHWDPNWLLTSGEYYGVRIRRILDRAIEALVREPGRVYSIECVFFLKMYWEKNPARREAIRDLVNGGRLRLTGSGNTTPDTLLPDTEALLRDYLYGQEWLRRNGMHQEPRVAYLPDNFGNSPALPSILRALGVTGAAFARLDGAFFPGCDYRPRAEFPLPGSNAHRLLAEERSLDFVWRDATHAEVVAHFHAGGYGQGDLLAHRGLTRWMGMPLAFPARSERRVARRIAEFVAELSPLARTPYLFCPIGFDFVDPIRDLVSLLERYNRLRYGETGVWVVCAGLDDYLDLVGFHRVRLPVIDLDPNPYWTGFYAARPALKRGCRKLVDDLLEVEALRLVVGGTGSPATGAAAANEGGDPWFWATTANHHDFITGTSPDRVHAAEQAPRIRTALEGVDATAREIERRLPPRPAAALAPRPHHAREGRLVRVETGDYTMELDASRGGCITRLTDARTGAALLDAPSADLVSCRDSGGLWRMGHEYRGGELRELDAQSRHVVEIEVHELPGALELVTRMRVGGDRLTRTLWLRTDTPVVRLRVAGLLSRRRSLLLRLRAGLLSPRATMDVPGGTVERAAHKLYTPTFWAANRFVHFRRAGGPAGVALLLPGPASVAFDPAGVVDCVALRNATQERAFGWLPMLGFPASGHEDAPATCDVALAFSPQGDFVHNRLHAAARAAFDDPWDGPDQAARRGFADALFVTNRPEVVVLAVKPACRGAGVIVRLFVPRPEPSTTMWLTRGRTAGIAPSRASLCDARERDIETLHVERGAVRVPSDASIVTVRVHG